LNELAHLCADHGVPIKCADGFSPDVSTPTGRLVLSLLGAIHQYQAEWTAEAAANAISVRRARGDVLGRLPYDAATTAAVVTAFNDSGSFLGACKLLNAQNVPTRLGGLWNVRTVSRVLRRTDTSGLPARKRQGERAGRSKHIFSGLLKCHCGDILTTMPRRDASVGYYCKHAHHDPSHSRPYVVAETKLLPWAKEEVTRGAGSHWLDVTYRDVNQKERDRLEVRRERVMGSYLDMRFDKATLDRLLGELDVELQALGNEDRAIESWAFKPTIVWTNEPGAINERLREMWRFVRLGSDLLPVEAEWFTTQQEREAAEDAQFASVASTDF